MIMKPKVEHFRFYRSYFLTSLMLLSMLTYLCLSFAPNTRIPQGPDSARPVGILTALHPQLTSSISSCSNFPDYISSQAESCCCCSQQLESHSSNIHPSLSSTFSRGILFYFALLCYVFTNFDTSLLTESDQHNWSSQWQILLFPPPSFSLSFSGPQTLSLQQYPMLLSFVFSSDLFI